MGSLNSKVQISVPPTPSCFATYEEEEEISETVDKIRECHVQAVQLASWIASAMFPAYAGGFAFSAATYLLTFIIHRLTSNSEQPSRSTPNPASKGPLRRKSSNNNNSNSLESALIDSKVDVAIAKKSVCELRAKMHAIQNRLQRLQQPDKISEDERRLEVVPAIQACEEVLQLFANSEHVFRKHPIVAAPILMPFSGVFLAIAELSIKLIPSYKEELTNEMKLMGDVLNVYMTDCIQSRVDGISFKTVQPGSMLDAVAAGSFADCNYRLEDSFISFKSFADPDAEVDKERVYSDPKEAMATYKREIEEKYTSLFGVALDTVGKFSGFQEKDHDNNHGHEHDATLDTVGQFTGFEGRDHSHGHSHELDATFQENDHNHGYSHERGPTFHEINLAERNLQNLDDSDSDVTIETIDTDTATVIENSNEQHAYEEDEFN